jgi:hypothetical protein
MDLDRIHSPIRQFTLLKKYIRFWAWIHLKSDWIQYAFSSLQQFSLIIRL